MSTDARRKGVLIAVGAVAAVTPDAMLLRWARTCGATAWQIAFFKIRRELIDDGIDINVLIGDRHRLELPHVATSHHFDENPRVLIDQGHLAPAENDVERAL